MNVQGEVSTLFLQPYEYVGNFHLTGWSMRSCNHFTNVLIPYKTNYRFNSITVEKLEKLLFEMLISFF